ncbi:MAG: hypothetical protein ACXQS7_05185 [Candidatus Syntropharchaeia archaeon]
MLGIEKKLFSLDKNLPIARISSNCIDFVQFLIDYEYIAGCKNGFARYLNHERENDSLLTTVLLGELARTRFVSKKTLKKIYEGKLFQYNDEEEFSGHKFYSVILSPKRIPDILEENCLTIPIFRSVEGIIHFYIPEEVIANMMDISRIEDVDERTTKTAILVWMEISREKGGMDFKKVDKNWIEDMLSLEMTIGGKNFFLVTLP